MGDRPPIDAPDASFAGLRSLAKGLPKISDPSFGNKQLHQVSEGDQSGEYPDSKCSKLVGDNGRTRRKGTGLPVDALRSALLPASSQTVQSLFSTAGFP